MSLLDKLEKKLNFLSIPNLTAILLIGQIISYFIIKANQHFAEAMIFFPAAIYNGEWWRILSFIFYPDTNISPIFLFFVWYFFYFIGKSLENYWGDFRYSLFIIIGWFATILVALISPFIFSPELAYIPVSNSFIATTLFLAFAHFNPEHEILFMMILPVKMKWLAWITWFGLLYGFIFGGLATKMAILASISNYLVFFGKEIYQNLRYGYRRTVKKASSSLEAVTPIYKCKICGATEISNPEKEFRFCSKCEGHVSYCLEHLKDHQHITK